MFSWLMARLIDQLRSWRDRTYVRPWALAAPVVVLLICLPLLRPLRHPDPMAMSHDEAARLATIAAVGERQTLVIDPAWARFSNQIIHDRTNETILYADQPATLGVLLGGVYGLLTKLGFTLDSNPVLVAYLLTLFGSTLPVAVGAGLVYRMGRVFELRRSLRATLGLGVVCASGLISYATVLNAYAPASALVLASVACLVQVGMSRNPRRGGGWIALAGFFASLATVIEPTAGVFLALLALSAPAMRWRLSIRLGALLLYVIGCSVPLSLHAVLTIPVTGDLRPGFLHPELAVHARAAPLPTSTSPGEFSTLDLGDEGDWIDDSMWLTIGRTTNRLGLVLFGSHGIFSHFPILLIGIFGIFAVMHRHWPGMVKLLAGATGIGALVLIAIFALHRAPMLEPMFGAPWFAVFLPLLLFWAGAWLRRPHPWWTWTLVGIAAAFSVTVALIGATYPFPRDGYSGYSAGGAARELFLKSQEDETRPSVAWSR